MKNNASFHTIFGIEKWFCREWVAILKIHIAPEAITWFQDQFDLTKGDSLRIFVRYGGCGSIQQGFSLGFSEEKPNNVWSNLEVDGVQFFIAEEDAWYFEEKDLEIVYQSKTDEIEFVHH